MFDSDRPRHMPTLLYSVYSGCVELLRYNYIFKRYSTVIAKNDYE